MNQEIWRALWGYFQARRENDEFLMEQAVRNIEFWMKLADLGRYQPGVGKQ